MYLLLALVLFAADPFLSRFLGEWSGTGTVLNQPAKIEMQWSWELDDQFIRLTFRDEMGVEPKANTFKGQAYYRAAGDDRYRGTWFDNSGMVRPLEARRDGESLVSRWGTADTEEGETTYRLLSNDRMEVIDRVKSKDGTWKVFGRSELTKR